MNYMIWIKQLYRLSCKTNQQMNQTISADFMIDVVEMMPNWKIKRVNQTNTAMGE
jgi:hypothetical protein